MPLRADDRIKLTIGSQFVEVQVLQDRIADLESQLADRDKAIADLVAAQKAPERRNHEMVSS